MRRSLVVGGSIGIIILLALTSFPSVVEAKSVSNDIPTKIIQNITKKVEVKKLYNYTPVSIIGRLLDLIWDFIYIIFFIIAHFFP